MSSPHDADRNPSSQDSESTSETRRLTSRISYLEERLEAVRGEQVEYLQNVSHQLVAPLNAIKWHIENLTSARIGVARAKKVLRSVYSQATLAVHLAKNFALMSNLEADHTLAALQEPLQSVNLCKMLIHLADDFQPQGWDRDVQVIVKDETFSNCPEVLVIRPLISQSFSNIIENAVKYSGRKTQVLVTANFDSSADVVFVSVKSRGIPLSAADAEKVFERGYRTPDAINAYPAGTGFGLYIASRIVDLHEGTIRAESAKGGTVTFTVGLSVKALEGKTRYRAPKETPS